MNTLQIGLLYGGATVAALFSGIPIAFALGAFVILVFIVTIVRMGGHVVDKAPI